MKRALKRIIMLSMIAMILSSLSIVALADDATVVKQELAINTFVLAHVTVNTNGAKDASGYTIVCTDAPALQSYIFTDSTKITDGGTAVNGAVSKDKVALYYSTAKVQKISDAIANYTNSQAVSGKVSNLTNGFDVSADTASAANMLSGFKGIFSLVLGIISTMIVLGMALFTSFDVCYIAFPVFRNKLDAAKDDGNKVLSKTDKNGDSSLRWVTDDAQYAVKKGDIDSGKSPWVLYFSKRVGSYIALSIILFILLTGNIAIIAQLAINVVSGIMNVISGLAA